MEISIWSDIRCPFCYIGKRKFEAALKDFAHSDKIQVAWKSFELDPSLETQTDMNAIEHFIGSKGIEKEQAMQMFEGATQMAKDAGIDFNLEKSVPANSLKAHRLLHFAKTKGSVDSLKEALLSAQLVEGKNIDDIDFLAALGASHGLDETEVRTMLASDDFTYEVRQDQMEARNLGISGVPFFVLNNKYGVSGAQPSEVFLETLENAWAAYEKENSGLDIIEGKTCDVSGNCD